MKMSNIDISKMNKCEVVAKLFNASKAQGMGFFQTGHNQKMSATEAEKHLDNAGDGYFDYLNGRVMKVDVSGDELNPSLYDRDNGQGAAERALN
jgi:hypothetical protein